MGRALAGYGLGLGLVTLAGLFIGADEPMVQAAHPSPGQLDVFVILLRAYTPLLAPVSSALGQPMIGGSPPLGMIPLLLWLAVGYVVGLLLMSPDAAGKATFLTSATVIMLWIYSLFFSAPAWADQSLWLATVSGLSRDLVSRPVDLAFILIAPALLSALTGQIMEIVRHKPDRGRMGEYALY
jgi:hypothetical protein